MEKYDALITYVCISYTTIGSIQTSDGAEELIEHYTIGKDFLYAELNEERQELTIFRTLNEFSIYRSWESLTFTKIDTGHKIIYLDDKYCFVKKVMLQRYKKGYQSKMPPKEEYAIAVNACDYSKVVFIHNSTYKNTYWENL